MKPLLILDRDVVVIDASDSTAGMPEELVPVPGSLEAIARANHLGYRVVVLSRESGLAKGELDVGQMNSIHHRLAQRANAVGGCIDAFCICPHAAEDDCHCDQPDAGILKSLTDRLRISPEQAIVVGDTLGHLETARRLGARAVLVRSDKGAITEAAANDSDPEPVPVFNNLAEAVDQLLVRAHA
jgi:D-glycero-D-manno-heptose 1,7-bisphosphate phosphatase